jgi:hypothetical protein
MMVMMVMSMDGCHHDAATTDDDDPDIEQR